MTKYSALLEKVTQHIASSYRKRAAQTLLSSRNAVLAPASEQATETTEYELITWLVILKPDAN
jgi:hypothetical protein